jgi:hypothetical protein
VRFLVPSAVLLLAACAGQQPPSPAAALGPDLAEARRLLLSSNGPVPVEIDAAPAVLGSDPRGVVARAASEATQWAAASFTPAPATTGAAGPRLVMQFEDTGDATACSGTMVPTTLSMAPSRVRAVMCDGNRPVAEAVGRAQGADAQSVQAMVTQATARLFPRIGGEETTAGGWSRSAPGVSLGGWIGSGGGSGVGVGLGF